MKTKQKMILITVIVGVLLFAVQVVITFADSIVHREWILEYEGLKTHEAQVLSGQDYPAPVYPTATPTKKPKKPSKNETTEPYPAPPVVPTIEPYPAPVEPTKVPEQRINATWWHVEWEPLPVLAYFDPRPIIHKSKIRDDGTKWYQISFRHGVKTWARPANHLPPPELPTPAPTMSP